MNFVNVVCMIIVSLEIAFACYPVGMSQQVDACLQSVIKSSNEPLCKTDFDDNNLLHGISSGL